MWRLFFLTVAVTSLALACSDDASSGDDADAAIGPIGGGGGGPVGGGGGVAPMGGGSGPTGCTSDFDCGQGQVCASGMCRPGQCNREKTCEPGQICDPVTYTCSGTPQVMCSGDPECAGMGLCKDGTCQDVQCVNNGHCDPGQECNAQNRCVAVVECVDGDGDGYGQNCDLGADCDDGNGDVNPGVVENENALCGDGTDHDCDGEDAECGVVETDNDGDGVSVEDGDCDDNNAGINPNQPEVPYNGLNDDCKDSTRDDDIDGDGFGTRDDACMMDAGNCDCDDRNVEINPETAEIPCNDVDENCDPADNCPDPGGDADMDGVTADGGDCDDNNPAINPNVPEVPYNGINDDCSDATPDNDLDGDGFQTPADCDDNNAAVNPGAAEVYYNNIDDDCNTETIDNDRDGDTFVGAMAGGNDCNDESPAVNPDAMETPYNGADDDCNPATRDDDIDMDNHPQATDCDDNNPAIHPDVVEDANTNCDDGIDHNCVGGDATCGAPDADGDGIADADDCEPNNAAIPGPVEIPDNGIDDDCDPTTLDACDDDAFDNAVDNGTFANAAAVEDGNTTRVQYGNLVACPGDDDWYEVTLQEGDGLEVDLAFDNEMGDIDVLLFKAGDDGSLVFVDGSLGVSNSETVYERRATAGATYYVRVYAYEPLRNTYSMTINVFEQCTDDVQGFRSEHNDSRSETTDLPAGEPRMLCDYDEDWYEFTLGGASNVRLDLLFEDDNGDLDMELYEAGQDGRIASSTSFTDDETIERQIGPGTFYVRVYGFQGQTNRYRLFQSSGESAELRQVLADDIPVPDRTADGPGSVDVDLAFAAPAGTLIRSLTIRDLDLNHDYLRDLRLIALWNGAEVAVLWDRQGGLDGSDGGEDDDFVPFTGGDINFDNRRYREFEGLPAAGTFTLRIEDHAFGDTGELVDLDVEIEYLLP